MLALQDEVCVPDSSEHVCGLTEVQVDKCKTVR
jgi:hypothetical protein